LSLSAIAAQLASPLPFSFVAVAGAFTKERGHNADWINPDEMHQPYAKISGKGKEAKAAR